MPLSRLLLAVPCLALIGGCAATQSATPALPTPAVTASASPVAHDRPVRHHWVRMTDPGGISFAMPTHRDEVQNGPNRRTYEDSTTPITYRVDVFDFPTPAGARLVAEHLDEESLALLVGYGFENSQVSSTGSGSTRDFTLMVQGEGIQADLLHYVRVRTLTSGKTMTMLLVLGVDNKPEALQRRVDRARDRLVRSVRYPAA